MPTNPEQGDVSAVMKEKRMSNVERVAKNALLTAKLTASSASWKDDAKHAIESMSELEELTLQILAEISKYSTSSPEYYQLVSITGGLKDQYDQADYLAEQIYEQQKSATILSMYTPKKESIQARFATNAMGGLAKRVEKLNGLKYQAEVNEGTKAVAAKIFEGMKKYMGPFASGSSE